MCGFITLFKRNIGEEEIEKIKYAGEVIKHRGPDDTQQYIGKDAILSFKRLSIVDLENGRQPFNFKDKYHIVFNGEIYNYQEIRSELIKDGYEFHTNSEIEVIASLYDKVGMEFVKSLRGMFAINIYDTIEDKFVVTRDHFGIKPLYYRENDDELFVSSEFKGLTAITENLTYSPELLNQYVTFQYIPGFDTLFKEIKQLPPGHILEKKIGQKAKVERYFKVELKPSEHNKEELKAQIREAMKETVKAHMIADVPVASFLSSGIDSSIVAMLASELTPNLTTFTIGFDVEGYDESPYAERFCKEFNIKNETIKLNYKDYVRDLPRIIYHMDNPIADPSIIPLYHICNRVRKDFKVVLSGEGSDEFFGGYNIYSEDESLKKFEKMPNFLKKLILAFSKLIPNNVRGKSFLERGCTPLKDRYVGNARIFTEDERKEILLNYNSNIDFRDITGDLFKDVEHLDNVCKRQYVDINTWLIGDILAKADRMSMANSLELRVPFLDVEVFKLASTLSKDEKIQGFTTKAMLREAFRGILPDYIYEKRKLGYPVPIRVWLKGELFDWATDIIKNNNVPDINKDFAIKLLNDHKAGKADYSRKIWAIIVYIIWYRLYVDKTLTPDDQFTV